METSKIVALTVIVAVVGIISYLIFSNSQGETTIDPITQTHGGAGSSILCLVYPPSCKK